MHRSRLARLPEPFAIPGVARTTRYLSWLHLANSEALSLHVAIAPEPAVDHRNVFVLVHRTHFAQFFTAIRKLLIRNIGEPKRLAVSCQQRGAAEVNARPRKPALEFKMSNARVRPIK